MKLTSTQSPPCRTFNQKPLEDHNLARAPSMQQQRPSAAIPASGKSAPRLRLDWVRHYSPAESVLSTHIRYPLVLFSEYCVQYIPGSFWLFLLLC